MVFIYLYFNPYKKYWRAVIRQWNVKMTSQITVTMQFSVISYTILRFNCYTFCQKLSWYTWLKFMLSMRVANISHIEKCHKFKWKLFTSFVTTVNTLYLHFARPFPCQACTCIDYAKKVSFAEQTLILLKHYTLSILIWQT